MATITVKLPEDVAARLETEQVSKEQLDSFLVAAVKAWLMRYQEVEGARPKVESRPWSEAFQDSAVAFVDQLIDENQALFEELARL
jgi:mannitol-1-phosphate/altronate dehydrogenase